MSIPKEPRQLMINLMYLVLTAMLALNVSAEIINAFFALNKGMKTSNGIVDQSNTQIKGSIEKQATDYKNSGNDHYRSLATQAQQISKDFENYISGLTNDMTTQAGGPSKEFADGRPERFKDKDVPTNMFINNKKGDELQAKISETRAKFLALIEDPKDRGGMENSIALRVDSIAADSKAKTWSEYKFKQMPVAAVMPTLTKFASDSKTSETALLNFFLNKMGGTLIRFEKFKVAIAPKKSYLIKGDKFEADVYLAAYSDNPGTGIGISVNGSGLPLKDGVAHYESTPGGVGRQTVNAVATVRNPTTGQTTSVNGTFEYEVGEKSATISADKMNVIYIGVDNPMSISAAGVSSNDLKVSATGCTIDRSGSGWMAHATKSGTAQLTVTGGGLTVTKDFRVKQIPDPSPRFATKKGGGIGSGEARVQEGLQAVLDNFDFDAKCVIERFQLVRIPKRDDPKPADNQGARFSGTAANLMNAASPGDQYNFFGIKARCPGDQIARDIGSMSFFIK